MNPELRGELVRAGWDYSTHTNVMTVRLREVRINADKFPPLFSRVAVIRASELDALLADSARFDFTLSLYRKFPESFFKFLSREEIDSAMAGPLKP